MTGTHCEMTYLPNPNDVIVGLSFFNTWKAHLMLLIIHFLASFSLSVYGGLCLSGHPYCIASGLVSWDQTVGVLPGQSGKCCGAVQNPSTKWWVLKYYNTCKTLKGMLSATEALEQLVFKSVQWQYFDQPMHDHWNHVLEKKWHREQRRDWCSQMSHHCTVLQLRTPQYVFLFLLSVSLVENTGCFDDSQCGLSWKLLQLRVCTVHIALSLWLPSKVSDFWLFL